MILAERPVTLAEPSVVDPVRNVTSPVGEFPVTVAVSVTGLLSSDMVEEAEITVVVWVAPTISTDSVSIDVLTRLFVSPK